MKAMILAAGVGSRLRPLTDKTPKALIKIGGVPMLEIVLRRLIAAGVDGVVINTFHLAEQTQAFLKIKKNFGIPIEISHEAELLDTGGGLKKVSRFFSDGRPFLVHNVDVLTDIDLSALYRFHLEHPALATLAVSSRKSSRALVFDAKGFLRGRPSSEVNTGNSLAFNGIHALSPEIFSKMAEQGVFSITDVYVRLAKMGEKIQAFKCDQWHWQDIGSPLALEQARLHAKKDDKV